MKKRLKKLMTLVLAVVLVMTVVVTPASAQTRFSDISGHWAEGTILSLAERGIIHGYPDGTVKPDRAITQGEYATLLTYAGDVPHATGSASVVSWAQPFADALSAEGVLDAANDFSANEPITRLEIVSWTLRAMGAGDLAVCYSGISKFSDTADLQAGEAGYMALSSESGLLHGYPDGTARPEAYCTRAEAFAIISRYDKVKSYVEDYQRPVIPPTVPDVHPQMMVSLAGPAEAEAYTPVTVTVLHQNVERLEWEIKGNFGATAREASSWESNLGLDGGTVTFYENGHYDLIATAISADGRKEQYLLSIEIKDPAIRLVAPDEVPLYSDYNIVINARSDVSGLYWTVERDNTPVTSEVFFGDLTETRSTISFLAEGVYILTLHGVNGLGEAVEASHTVEVYREIRCGVWANTPVFVGDTSLISAEDAHLDEGSSFEWQVFEKGTQLDWLEVFDRNCDSQTGGEIKFIRAGEYTVRLAITNCNGRVFNEDIQARVYDRPDFSLTCSNTAYTEEDFEISSMGLETFNGSLDWFVNGKNIYQVREVIIGPEGLSRSGGSLSFSAPGEYQITLSASPFPGLCASRNVIVRVYPSIQVELYAPDTWTVGSPVSILSCYDNNVDDLIPEWLLKKDGEDVASDEFLEGSLGNGEITFLIPGEYTVVTSVTDSLGRCFSASKIIHVLDEFSAPELTGSPVGYLNTPFELSFSKVMTAYDVQWSIRKEGEEISSDLFQGELDANGGHITFSDTGIYCITAVIANSFGGSASEQISVEIREAPYIRMNPLDRLTNEERLDYVYIIHTETSTGAFPTFRNTEGMKVTFDLLKDGEPADEEAALFYSYDTGYSIQPSQEGEYDVRATVEDDYGNTFTFFAHIKVVATIYAKITGLPETAGVYETLSVTAVPVDISNETIQWKLSYLPGEAAENYMDWGVSNLWPIAKEWQEIAFEDVGDFNLCDTGGDICFWRPGIYCLRTSVTDQYDHTVEKFKVLQIYSR